MVAVIVVVAVNLKKQRRRLNCQSGQGRMPKKRWQRAQPLPTSTRTHTNSMAVSVLLDSSLFNSRLLKPLVVWMLARLGFKRVSVSTCLPTCKMWWTLKSVKLGVSLGLWVLSNKRRQHRQERLVVDATQSCGQNVSAICPSKWGTSKPEVHKRHTIKPPINFVKALLSNLVWRKCRGRWARNSNNKLSVRWTWRIRTS